MHTRLLVPLKFSTRKRAALMYLWTPPNPVNACAEANPPNINLRDARPENADWSARGAKAPRAVFYLSRVSLLGFEPAPTLAGPLRRTWVPPASADEPSA